MRSRKASQQHVADVARRRLELLSAELAAIRPEPVESPVLESRDGSGEPPRMAADGAPPGPAEPGRHAHRPVGLSRRLSGWVGDRLPVGLQDRFSLRAGHLVVVLLVALVGIGVTAWWLARAEGGSQPLPIASSSAPLVTGTATGRPVPGATTTSPGPAATGRPGAGTAAAATAAPAAVPGAASTAGAAAASGSIVVDVAGKVRRPGIATLPLGSRVVDAIRAAGGARGGVGLGSLNLARVLSDGEQIVVGAPAATVPSAAGAGTSGGVGGSGESGTPATPMVDVNTASEAELESLPDIGPVTAQAILDYRSENGSFASVGDLLDVDGIGDATLAKITPYVTL